MAKEGERQGQAERFYNWQPRDELRRLIYRIVYPECFNEEDIEILLKSASGEKPLTLAERIPYSEKFEAAGLTHEITGRRTESLLRLLTTEERVIAVLSTGLIQHHMFSCDEVSITLGVPQEDVNRYVQSSIRKINSNPLNKLN